MNDKAKLEDAIDHQDVEDIAAVLDDTPVDYTVDHSVPVCPQLEVPGYGTIFFDGSAGSPCGWAVRAAGADKRHWQPIEPDELLADLLDVIDMAEKVA